jgi:actin-related protein
MLHFLKHNKMFGGGDDANALVIDIGSTITRGGHAGEDAPKILLPSVVGVLNEARTEGEMIVES